MYLLKVLPFLMHDQETKQKPIILCREMGNLNCVWDLSGKTGSLPGEFTAMSPY